MNPITRFLSTAFFAALLGQAPSALAQDYPSKPIIVLHGLAVGGQTDQSVRLLSDAVAKVLHTPLVVEARPGAAQTIAATALANSRPDGYTIGHFYQGVFSTTPLVQKTVDRRDDLTPIIAWQMSPQLLVVRSDSPYKTLAELVEAAKSPDGVYFGHTGKGTVTFLAPTVFAKVAGIHLNEVQYKGDSDLITAVLGGHLPMASVTEVAAAPLIESGKMRALVTFGQTRSSNFPDVPTFKEQGYDVPIQVPVGIIFAPKGTPQAIRQTLHDAIKKALDDPEVKSQFARMKQVLYYMNGDDVDALIDKERNVYSPILREVFAD